MKNEKEIVYVKVKTSKTAWVGLFLTLACLPLAARLLIDYIANTY